MALGKTVKALRDARGWTLKELSKRSGVPVGTIGALEVRDSVRSEYAAKLAQGFGVSLEELLATGQGEMLPVAPPDHKQNHALAQVQQAPVAISFDDAVRVIAVKLMEVDEATGRRAMGVLADLATDPNDFERLARATLAVIETGKRRAA